MPTTYQDSRPSNLPDDPKTDNDVRVTTIRIPEAPKLFLKEAALKIERSGHKCSWSDLMRDGGLRLAEEILGRKLDPQAA